MRSRCCRDWNVIAVPTRISVSFFYFQFKKVRRARLPGAPFTFIPESESEVRLKCDFYSHARLYGPLMHKINPLLRPKSVLLYFRLFVEIVELTLLLLMGSAMSREFVSEGGQLHFCAMYVTSLLRAAAHRRPTDFSSAFAPTIFLAFYGQALYFVLCSDIRRPHIHTVISLLWPVYPVKRVELKISQNSEKVTAPPCFVSHCPCCICAMV